VDPTGFYLGLGEPVGQSTDSNNYTFYQYKYYAQRWNKSGNSFAAAEKINVPGPLVRTWAPSPGSRNFMTQDQQYVYIPPATKDGYGYYRPDTRLNLLRQVSVGGKPPRSCWTPRCLATSTWLSHRLGRHYVRDWRAELLGLGYSMAIGPGGGVANSGASSTPDWQTTSDRLMIYDLSNNTFATLYDQPTKAYNLQINGRHPGPLVFSICQAMVPAVAVPSLSTGSFLRTLDGPHPAVAE